MFNTNYGMYSGYEVEKETEVKKEYTTGTSNMASTCTDGRVPYMMNTPLTGMIMPPVYECPQERQIHRQIVHEVPHVCPINTRIINHHIYRHTYSPCYTCCEENEVCNVNEGCCGNF